MNEQVISPAPSSPMKCPCRGSLTGSRIIPSGRYTDTLLYPNLTIYLTERSGQGFGFRVKAPIVFTSDALLSMRGVHKSWISNHQEQDEIGAGQRVS